MPKCARGSSGDYLLIKCFVRGLGFALGPVSTVAADVRGLVCAKVA